MSTCPITQETYVDPVMVPCCGQSFERSAIIEWLDNSTLCPLCKANIEDFDPQTAVTNRGILGLASVAQPILPVAATTQNEPPKYSAQTVNMGDFNVTRIMSTGGTIDESFLNIIIADESGSMAGARWNAVVRGIKHMHALYPNNNMYICYHSYAAVKRYVDVISQFANGGTNFLAAFKLLNDKTSVKIPAAVKQINVVFMTDGEACFDNQCINEIKKFVSDNSDLGRTIVFNSVGISREHSVHPLDTVRGLGTQPGVYCFADTTENGSEDIYNKLSQLSACAMSSSKTVVVQGLDADIREVILGDLVLSHSIPKTLIVDGDEIVVDDGPAEDFREKLFSKVVSELSQAAINGLGALPACKSIIERYLDMIIGTGLPDESPLHAPIQMIRAVLDGQTIDKKNLLDLASGIYTSRVTKSTEHNATVSKQPQQRYVTTHMYDPMYQGRRVDKKITRIYFTSKDRNIPDEIERAAAGYLSCINNYDATDAHGNNVLHFLCMAGRCNNVSTLVRRLGYDDTTNNDGYTPFMLAVTRGYWLTITELLPHITDTQELLDCLVYCANKEWHMSANVIYPRYLELNGGSIAGCEFSGYGYGWYLRNHRSGPTTIKDVIRSGDVSMLSDVDFSTERIEWWHLHEVIDNEALFLAMLGRVDNSTLEAFNPAKTGDEGSPLIFLTISKNKPTLFKALLERKVNVNSLNHKDSTPLFHAAYKGNLDMFCDLIDHDADPLFINTDNETALMPACQYNHVDIVELLLEYNLDPNLRNKRGETPISSSVRMGRDNVVKVLLSSKKVTTETILTKIKIDGFDCVLSCIEQDRPTTIQLLYEHFLSLGREDLFWNDTCLADNFLYPSAGIWHIVAKYNAVRVFGYLITLPGFRTDDLYVRDTEGRTALHVAVAYDNYAILQSFKKVPGIDFSVQDTNGQTPKSFASIGSKAYTVFFDKLALQLFTVTSRESIDIVLKLMSSLSLTTRVFGNVIMTCRNNDDETWLHVAARNDNQYLFSVLLEAFGESALNQTDGRGLTPAFWEDVHSGNESVKWIKELFKGSMLMLFKARSSGESSNPSNDTRLIPAQYSGYTTIKHLLSPDQMLDLKNYIIVALVKSRTTSEVRSIQELTLSWFLDNGFSAPNDLISEQSLKTYRGTFYKIITGSSVVGIGSELDFGCLVYKTIPSDLDMSQAVIYEYTSPKLYVTCTNQYYLPPKKRTVKAICRADKFAILQSNIRQTTYALSRGQVTGMIVEVNDS